ncbi:MAG: raffinose/stachyose/melibiose transport system permease protein [Gaiellaceae bacterium]|nr:raffinose/stachyose/melibiose transport system permease protein [Gaiellaceae bacterium]
MLKVRSHVPYLYCAPLVALLAVIFAYPILRVADFSTRLIRGASGPFIGLDNYRFILDDPTFREALKHSVLLLLCVPVLLVISILLATLLYEQLPAWKFFRTILFLPYILAIPVVGIVGSFMFQLHGPVNQALEAVGLDRLAIDWLGQERYALLTVALVIVAREVGFGIVLFLARMMTLDASHLEAARIDGAGWFQRLRYVILPEIRWTVEFYVVVAAITMLAWVFSYVYTLTQGGPGTATITMELYIYNVGEVQSTPGMASAAAAVLLVATSVLIAFLFLARWRAARAEAQGT